MPPVVATLASLLLGTGLLLLGNGLLGTLLAIRLLQAGFGPGAAGLVMSAYFAGFSVGAAYAGRVILSTGHIRTFAAFAAVFAAAALAHGLAPPSWAWAGLRAIAGFSMAALYMTVESWLNAASTNEVRGRVVSTYMLVVYGALGGGQLLLNLWPVEGIELFCLVGLLTSLAVLPVALTRAAGPALERDPALPLRVLLEAAPLGLLGALVAGALTGGVYAVAPLYAHLVGLSPAGVSLFMSALVLGGLAFQLPLGRVSDRVDRRTVLLAVSLALAATSGVLGLYPGGAGPGLYALAVVFGGLVFALYPLALAHVFDRVERPRVLRASSLVLMASAVGSTLGPPVASLAMHGVGPAGFFAYAAALALALAAAVAYRVRTHERAGAQEAFVAMPRTTPGVGGLDPRA